MEINKEATWNPIKQDVKDGKLRDYPTPSVVHYGAIPQTYEHPSEEDDLTGLTGDGDPIDIVDISDYAAHTGDVYDVKVLGALAMIDDDAADWKIIAIRATDPLAAELHGELGGALRGGAGRPEVAPGCRSAGGQHGTHVARPVSSLPTNMPACLPARCHLVPGLQTSRTCCQ